MANKIIVAAVLVLMVNIADATICYSLSECGSCEMCVRENRLCQNSGRPCECVSVGCGVFDLQLNNGDGNIPAFGKTCSCNNGAPYCTGNWDGSQPTNFPELTHTSGC